MISIPISKQKIAQQKKDFEDLRSLQKQYYDERNKYVGAETDSESELYHLGRAIELHEKLNKRRQEVVLTGEQENQLYREALQYQERAKELEAKSTDDKSKQEFKNIRQLYNEYLKSQEAIQKMELDATSGKDYTAPLALEQSTMEKRQRELWALGVDVAAIEKSSVLTQKQKKILIQVSKPLKLP